MFTHVEVFLTKSITDYSTQAFTQTKQWKTKEKKMHLKKVKIKIASWGSFSQNKFGGAGCLGLWNVDAHVVGIAHLVESHDCLKKR